MSEDTFNATVIEALILASPEPLPARKIADQLENMTPAQVGRAVAGINNRYFQAGISFRIREIAGGYQFYILPEYTGYVDEMFTRRRKMRLTRAALETLAIVAYRQPVTKTDIEHIRGVASDGVLQNLLEKGMVTIRGRAATVGKPLQYGTTDEFLKFFGLASLDDLPKMKEIEELIRASEPDNGDQLSFETNVLDVAMARKLNVADGTFDPNSREGDDPDPELDAAGIQEVDGNEDPEDAGTESPEDDLDADDLDDHEDLEDQALRNEAMFGDEFDADDADGYLGDEVADDESEDVEADRGNDR